MSGDERLEFVGCVEEPEGTEGRHFSNPRSSFGAAAVGTTLRFMVLTLQKDIEHDENLSVNVAEKSILRMSTLISYYRESQTVKGAPLN